MESDMSDVTSYTAVETAFTYLPSAFGMSRSINVLLQDVLFQLSWRRWVPGEHHDNLVLVTTASVKLRPYARLPLINFQESFKLPAQLLHTTY